MIRSALALAVVFALTGCARSAEERQLDEMRSALTNVDENQAFGDKLTAKELAQIVKEQPTTPAAAGAPQQHVVQLEDGAEQEATAQDQAAGFEAADDPGPRPVIRAHGVPHARNSDTVEETMPDDASASTQAPQSQAPRPSALDPDARRAYDAALALVNAKHYTEALDAFAGFLLKYPDHPFVVNAMYWRGECYFAQGDYVRAMEQFEGVVARFPLGGKTPDALLKLGICQQKLGNPQQAQTYFDKLTREWPRSDAARRIPAASEKRP
ncbi:MAG TPA: tol-pal system protein YbgF [Polyangiaceae bacterium]|jgi:tol-pal system protein YbgF